MEEYYKEAKKKVKQKKSFYWNFASWLGMSIFFFVLNMVTEPSFHWWLFPTIGWGIGVASQYIKVFGVFNSKSWEKREIEKEMKRLYLKEKYTAAKAGMNLDEIDREKLELPDFEALKRELDDQDYV